MGLKEKRASKEFQETVYPKVKGQIRDILGFDVAVEVDWEKLAVTDREMSYNNDWLSIYFTPLMVAFTSVCADTMGKEALEDSLKKIEVTNSDQFFNPEGFKFVQGVLTLDHRMANPRDVKARAAGIQEILETAL
jgi:hypothetical protein